MALCHSRRRKLRSGEKSAGRVCGVMAELLRILGRIKISRLTIRREDGIVYLCNLNIAISSAEDFPKRRLLERESGEMPERSGHCIQRAGSMVHCVPESAREGGAGV